MLNPAKYRPTNVGYRPAAFAGIDWPSNITVAVLLTASSDPGAAAPVIAAGVVAPMPTRYTMTGSPGWTGLLAVTRVKSACEATTAPFRASNSGVAATTLMWSGTVNAPFTLMTIGY